MQNEDAVTGQRATLHPRESESAPGLLQFRTLNAIRTAEESPRLWMPDQQIAKQCQEQSGTPTSLPDFRCRPDDNL
jgi:hypothetical protein